MTQDATAKVADGPRQTFIAQHLDPNQCRIVEVGALDTPTYSARDGFNVRFIDYTTKQGLIDDNPNNPRYKTDTLVDVHYAIYDGDYAAIPERFDLAIANHVIEHIPDMIGWLKGLRSVLNQGGCLFLSVPDRRHTFDYLRPETRVSEFLAAHREKQTVPTWRQIFDHFYYYRKLDSKITWAGNFDVILATPRSSIAEARRNADRMSSGEFVSLHCNVYTYDTFLQCAKELQKLGELPFEIIGAQDVLEGRNEFNVLLRAV